MSNNETETIDISSNNESRTSIITKSIKRTILVSNYEPLVIEEGIEEEITWSTLSERQEKVKNWEIVLIKNFKDSLRKTAAELGIQNNKRILKELGEQREETHLLNSTENEHIPENNLDIFDNLDSLDDIG